MASRSKKKKLPVKDIILIIRVYIFQTIIEGLTEFEDFHRITEQPIDQSEIFISFEDFPKSFKLVRKMTIIRG